MGNNLGVQKELNTESIERQIMRALDGRTRRWLHYEVKISERDLSLKMKGRLEWKESELAAIEERLGFKIKREAVV